MTETRDSSAGALGCLYVVATPLGNLADLSPRAVRTLREASLVACEDTRRTRVLLDAHQIRTPTTSYYEHNERFRERKILAALEQGCNVALVSDAGTPGISDPGYRLVRAAQALGARVVPIPGPSAVIAALSVSGLPTDRFLFVGFLPAREQARRRALDELRSVPWTLVFYESPLRVCAALDEMLAVFGDRAAFLCREATKVHEEYGSGTLASLSAILSARASVKGEIVLVVAGCTDACAESTENVEEMVARLMAEGLTRRQSVKATAERLHLPARDVYRRALAVSAPVETDEKE
ncbi:MAG: 16S rRNA (cytidine(1402)-2'-O)-methyltransferase [Vicinamibacteria bacterium]|jgi:16S rRNA (cytidine1402-2'-O)-methyltransferase|nr:16S rRNA (cytidine(1402)-2'-O)-methyltransferase [Vicinamibacteria bacterium]